MPELAPIVLFVYNRPWHALQTLEALEKNDLASESILYIFADGPKKNADEKTINQIRDTRAIIKKNLWCKEVVIHERENNLGLAESIITGVTEIINKYGNIIVLEDDIVTSSGFLSYVNSALRLYDSNEKVMHISAYQYPIESPQQLPSTFFVNIPTCWGWGTWARAWQNFNNDSSYLSRELHRNGILKKFNLDNNYDYYSQIEQNEKGILKTWAVKWYASFLLKKGFSLHPNYSLTKNIGLDNSGENCNDLSGKYLNQNTTAEINVSQTDLKESKLARKKIGQFLNKGANTGSVYRFRNSLKNVIRKNLPISILFNLQNPVSRVFGFDRGLPIDRFYIEEFLKTNGDKIHGVVLEISESVYTNKFGVGIERSEVIDYSQSNPNATLIGDLTCFEKLPINFADCFICTQTLNFIYDFKKGIKGIYHILKQGGAALVTVAGICQVSQYDADRWGDYWRFNPQGIKIAFEEVFGKNNIEVKTYGNSYSATALLKGIAADEIKRNKLTFFDKDYPVVIAIIAKKNV